MVEAEVLKILRKGQKKLKYGKLRFGKATFRSQEIWELSRIPSNTVPFL